MHLLPMIDQHFAWLLDECAPPLDVPAHIAEGGIAAPEVIAMLRALVAKLGGEAAWLMVVDDEAVGMISVKERDAAGRWDIGYGTASSCERRGYASAAVAALKDRARDLGAVGLTAETLVGGGVSSRLLQRNGFLCTGQVDHPEDGWVDRWVVEW